MVNTPQYFKSLYQSLSKWKECVKCHNMVCPNKVTHYETNENDIIVICNDCDS